MFNSTSKKVESLEKELKYINESYRQLRAKHEQLVQALGLVEQVTERKVEYVKKGGPERL